MPTERTRDRVWKFALARAVKNERAVKPDYIAEVADASPRTVREVLNVMADAGWLDRDFEPDGSVRFLKPATIEYTQGVELAEEER